MGLNGTELVKCAREMADALPQLLHLDRQAVGVRDLLRELADEVEHLQYEECRQYNNAAIATEELKVVREERDSARAALQGGSGDNI